MEVASSEGRQVAYRMRRLPLYITLLVVMSLLLAACGAPTAQDSATPILTATTVETATSAPSATVTPTSTRPNDATQARLRVSQCVYDEPQMDVYVNGKVPIDAGIPLSYVGFSTTRYEYVEPGTHTVAVVPMGKGMDQALLAPLDVQMVAGHRYTVVVLGQKVDPTHKALVIDETAAYQAIGAKPTDIANIVVNNLKGAEGIDYTVSGVLAHSNVPYGGFKADIWRAAWTKGDKVSVTGTPDKVLAEEGKHISILRGLILWTAGAAPIRALLDRITTTLEATLRVLSMPLTSCRD